MKNWFWFGLYWVDKFAIKCYGRNRSPEAAAIDLGLAWLATQQLGDGSWPEANGYPAAATGSALLAFLEEKANWGVNTALYQAKVNAGWIIC